RLLGDEWHRRRPHFVAQDLLDGLDPARVAVIGAPEPVLTAPEQDRGKSGVLEVLEDAADRLRAGALGVGIVEVRRLPRFGLRLGDPRLLPLLVGQVTNAREPIRPVAIGVAHVVSPQELVADGGVDVEAEHVAPTENGQPAPLSAVRTETPPLAHGESLAGG